MLSVYTDKGYMPINNRSDFDIVYDYEGGQTLSFDIPTSDEIYSFLYEENLLHYDDNEFKINKINQRKTKSTVTAVLNLDDWKKGFYHDFHETYALFSEIVNLVIPDGWTVEGAGTVTGRRTINLEGATPYDILMQSMSTYNIVFEYHILKKTIKVIKPDTYQSRGLYITDELNLKELEFKGDSSIFATRLYAFGKKTEEKDEEGNVTSTTYVNFASINGGKLYVDNNEYSNKIIVQYWQDDRYTNPEELLNDAIDKLKELAKPSRSYSCKLIDLSRINEKYRYLDFKLYDKVTLIDSVSKVHVQHQIVEYVDYPDNRNNNSVSLSSTFKKITGTIDNIKQSISNIDTELLRKESTLNEIIRDVTSNTLRIQNTYTKGEVDEIEQSIIQQTSDSIDLAIQGVEEKIQEIDTSLFTYELQNDGTSVTNNNNVTLSAHVFNKGEDVTDDIQDIAFNWIRQSSDNEGDVEWNNAHKGIKSVILTPDDTYVSGVFYCQIVMSFGVQRTQAMTINDETDIADLKNSYLDPSGTSLIQQLNGTSYFPDWTATHAVLTPCVVDGLVSIDISQCAITYKRIENGAEVALGVGETVENGVLMISKNIMTKDKTSLDYVCYVSYKNSTIKLYRSYMLNVLGQDGSDGKDGADGNDGQNGNDGVSVISSLTYFAVSSSRATAPTSGWTTAEIARAEGQYLWMKVITKYDNNTSSESVPVMITGDKGDKGEQGLRGLQGIQGEQGIPGPKGDDGIDGKTTYFHIKYSSVANPTTASQMSETPNTYIGTYVDYTETDSTNPSDYTWSRFQGIQGEQGIQGVNGTNGKSSYLHIKYSNDNGVTFTANNGETPGDYIGVCVDENVTDPATVSSYTWSKIKGEDGTSIKISNRAITYQLGTSGTTAPTGTWSASVPTLTQGRYLWTRTVVTYSDNSSTTAYSVSYIAKDGADGVDGKDGATGPAGKGISGTPAVTYQAGTSGTTVPTDTWQSSVPTVSQGQYLWTRTITNYTDGTSTTAYSVAYIPTNGATGATGKGVASITPQWYVSTSKTSQTGGSWVETMPEWSVGKYLWKRFKIIYQNPSSTVYTTAECDSSWEAVNNIQVGGRNLLLNSRYIVLNSNNSSTYPISKEQMSEGSRTFYRYKRTSTTLSPTLMSLYGTIFIDNITESLVGEETTFSFLMRCSHDDIAFTIMEYIQVDGTNYNFVNSNESKKVVGKKWERFFVTTTITQDYETASNKLIRFNPYKLAIPSGEIDNFYVDVCEWKIEKGNMATDWSPAPEDIEDDIISNGNALTQSITESYTSAINEMKDQIELNVSKIIQTITGNENGEVAESVNSLSTSLNITAGQLSIVNQMVQEISDKITGLTTKEEISNWATLDANGILHLGTNRNNFEAQLSNTALEFYESGTKVAWISNNELHQLKAVIEDSLQIGRWLWEDNDTYGLVLKWVGG